MLARQPIYGANLRVRGYELLFRGPGARTTDGIAMTADVLVRAGLDVGVADLVGDKRVFVKAPRPFLVGDLEFPLPPRQTVIEVVQDVARTPEVVAGCRHLVQNGYALALDHYVWDDDDDPLLDMVSIIKLDVLSLTTTQLSNAVSHNSKFGVELLAEKIETREQLEVCQNLGFDLFEGYLLGRPDVVEGDALCPDKVVCLRLLEERPREGQLVGLDERRLHVLALGPRDPGPRPDRPRPQLPLLESGRGGRRPRPFPALAFRA